MADEFRPDPNRPGYLGSRSPLDPTRCKAGVHSNDRISRYSQCARKPYKDGWCRQHHPDAEAERQRAADERYNASMRKAAMGWYGERFMAALIKIRDGDNDPRATAAEALKGISYAHRQDQ